MKKLLFIILLIPFNLLSQSEYINGYTYQNNIRQNVEFGIIYDSPNKISLKVIEGNKSAYYDLENQVDSLRYLFKKYFEWQKQATEMNVAIEKEIIRFQEMFVGVYFNEPFKLYARNYCKFSGIFKSIDTNYHNHISHQMRE